MPLIAFRPLNCAIIFFSIALFLSITTIYQQIYNNHKICFIQPLLQNIQNAAVAEHLFCEKVIGKHLVINYAPMYAVGNPESGYKCGEKRLAGLGLFTENLHTIAKLVLIFTADIEFLDSKLHFT